MIQLNVLPAEASRILELDARCRERALSPDEFDEQQWLRGLAEILGAFNVLDMILAGTHGMKIAMKVIREDTPRPVVRLVGAIENTYFSKMGPGPFSWDEPMENSRLLGFEDGSIRKEKI